MMYRKVKQSDSDSAEVNKIQQQFISVLKHYNMFEPDSKYKIVCPFHDDVNASLQIDIENARFYCFGCNKSGRSFDIVKYFNPDFTQFEVLQYITKIAKGDTEKVDIRKIEKANRNLPAARDYYYNLPEVDWSICKEKEKRYLRKRGFTSKMLNQFKARINSSDNYRIIFPIFDNGVFRGYVCRTTVKEVEEKRKYLYNTGFRRRNTLAGTYENEDVLLVEGFLDMIKARQMGIKQVVAILGWQISEKQRVKLKRRGIKRIICGTDNDKAGRKGYEYIKALKEFEVERLHYPRGIKDFGDVSKKVFNERLKSQLNNYNIF